MLAALKNRKLIERDTGGQTEVELAADNAAAAFWITTAAREKTCIG